MSKGFKFCMDCAREFTNGTKVRCGPCNRKFKRRTKPSFYLGTCYSEIKRRCTRKIPNREYVAYNKEFCTKEEFINKFLTDDIFLSQYKMWQDGEFNRGIAPSIDRIDESNGYVIENLQFLSNNDNAKKSFNQKVILTNIITGKDIELDSQTITAKYLCISQPYLSKIMKENKLIRNTYKARWKK